MRTPAGDLNRGRLGEIIFNDPEKRKLLNKCTHPRIRRRIFSSLLYYYLTATPMVVIDAPLLYEAGLDRICSDVLVVFWYVLTLTHSLTHSDTAVTETRKNLDSWPEIQN